MTLRLRPQTGPSALSLRRRRRRRMQQRWHWGRREKKQSALLKRGCRWILPCAGAYELTLTPTRGTMQRLLRPLRERQRLLRVNEHRCTQDTTAAKRRIRHTVQIRLRLLRSTEEAAIIIPFVLIASS